jgi:hypothetical protein
MIAGDQNKETREDAGEHLSYILRNMDKDLKSPAASAMISFN